MSTLVAEWSFGVTTLDILKAVLSGDCPTLGVETFTVQPIARCIKFEGEVSGVDAVWAFLNDLKLVNTWPLASDTYYKNKEKTA